MINFWIDPIYAKLIQLKQANDSTKAQIHLSAIATLLFSEFFYKNTKNLVVNNRKQSTNSTFMRVQEYQIFPQIKIRSHFPNAHWSFGQASKTEDKIWRWNGKNNQRVSIDSGLTVKFEFMSLFWSDSISRSVQHWLLPIPLSIHKIPLKSRNYSDLVVFSCFYKMLNWNAFFHVCRFNCCYCCCCSLFSYFDVCWVAQRKHWHLSMFRFMECIHAQQQQWRTIPFNSAIYRTRHSSFGETCLCRATVVLLFLLHCIVTIVCTIHSFFGVLSLVRCVQTPFLPFTLFNFSIILYDKNVCVCLCMSAFFLFHIQEDVLVADVVP